MPGATLSNPNGVTTWTNNVDNWRSEDADYLQRRSVMRFANSSTRTAALGASPTRGQVSYLESTDDISYADSTGAWRTLTAFRFLATSDTSTSVGLRISSDGSTTLAIEPGRIALGASRFLIVDGTSVKIKTGATTANLTTDATALVSDVQFKAPTAGITGALTTGSIANSGTLSTASLTASGNVGANTLSVSGTSSLAAVTAASLASSGTVSGPTVTATTTLNGGNLRLAGIRLNNSTGTTGYVDIDNTVTAGGTNIVLIPASMAPVRYGSVSGPPMTVTVVSATDPGVANYPEGAIWIQP